MCDKFGNIDRELLERQAAILGRIVDGGNPAEEERTCLGGVWEFLHTILDGPQTPAAPPTVVMYIEGGVLLIVESNAPVHAMLCDYDLTGGDDIVGGQLCRVWDGGTPAAPTEEFNEVLTIVEAQKPKAEEVK